MVASTSAWAQNALTQQLISQGNYWHQRSRDDLAADTWNKLLRIDPQQPDALLGLAQIDLAQGHVEQARTRLQLLQATHPNAPQTGQLRNALANGGSGDSLQAARQASAAGNNVEAVRNYRKLFNGDAPPEGIALEYYQVLAGTPDGRNAARDGLSRLAAAHPGDHNIELAYAKILTYTDANRREGISNLKALAGLPVVGAPARAAWRQALIWLNANSSDVVLYRDYLSQSPDDAEISQRLAQLTSGAQRQQQDNNPAQLAITEGYKALQANKLLNAENFFLQALKARPGDGDALGGLGSVRLKQQRFPEARELLLKASRSNAGKWRSALNSASYWASLREAQAAHEKGNDARAQQLLFAAVKLEPGEPQGYAALGDSLSALGQAAKAEQAYKKAMELQTGYPAALRGLVTLYTHENKPELAMAMMQQATPAQREAMGGDSAIRSSAHRSRAQLALQQGNSETAQRELEAGLLETPGDPWIRLDLARVYQNEGRKEQAKGVMNGLLLAHPDSPVAIYANALFASESNEWSSTLALLARIPEAQRSSDMITLQQRAWLQQQAAAASRLTQQGHPLQAQQALSKAEGSLGDAVAQRPELLSTLAGAYADAGNPQRAMQLAQTLLSGPGGDTIDHRLLYASVLLKTHQDAELVATLRLLQTKTLSIEQQRQFNDLRVAYTLRQVDALREMGNLQGAYSALSALLAATPDDPQVVGALARLYSTANDQPQALRLYQQILQTKPNNLDAQVAAANTAAAMHDLKTAERYMAQALEQAADSPDVLAAAGRMYRVAGKNSKAEDYFRAALEARARLAGNASNGLPVSNDNMGMASSNPSFNPFAGMTGGTSASGATPLPMPANLIASDSASTAASAPFSVGGAWTPPGSSGPASANTGADAIPSPVGASTQDSVISTPAARQLSSGYPVPGSETRASNTGLPFSDRSARIPMTPVSTGDPILDELRDLQASNSSSVGTGVVYRSRTGEAGLGQLTDLEVPFEGQLAVGDGKLTFDATPTLVDAGQAVDDYGTTSRFGAGPSASLAAALGSQSDLINSLTSGSLYQSLLTEGNTQATRNVIYQNALSDGEYQTLYDLTDGTLTATERKQATLQALYAQPLPQYILSQNLSATPINTIATQILGNSSLSSGLDATELATLQRLAQSSASNMTPAGFQSQLYTLAASSAGSRRLSNQDAAGMGLSVGYGQGGLKADIGSSPLGFRESQLIGGVAYAGSFGDDVTYHGSLSRRAVTDSLLSFAGARDQRTDLSWGGVTATGGQLGLTIDNGLIGGYGNLGVQQLKGHNVASNHREEIGAGVYVHAIQTQAQSLTAGLSVTGMRYAKNLAGFTYGQGGYFSPQRYVEVGFPVHWTGNGNSLSWKVDASLGAQTFKEDSSPYFPTSAAMQSAAYDAASIATLLGLTDTYVEPVYAGQSKTGLSYNLGGTAEWQLAPQLYLGGQMELNNARDYKQFSTNLYLRFLLDSAGGNANHLPSPVQSPYTPRN